MSSSETPTHSPISNLRERIISSPRYRARWIAASYAIFATMWIYFSDNALNLLIKDPQVLISWSVYKGFAFVALTSFLLLVLMIRAFGTIEDSYLSLKAQDELLEASEEKLSAIICSAMDAIITVDTNHRVTLFNDAAQKIFGCTEAMALSLHIRDFIPEALNHSSKSNVILRGHRHDGEVFPLEASISRTETKSNQFFTYILRDVSQRHAHEAEIERLTRLYAALSQINQAIVWTSTRDELLNRVCQVLVEFGGFRMAWIGWHDPSTQLIEPVAQWGDENNYLQSIQIYADDRPEGRGPTGTSFREEKPSICNNLLDDPVALLWHDEAVKRGFHASAVYPIRIDGKVCATLTVYADALDFFQEQEQALLAEAALDISFALDNLARQEESQRLEAIVRSEKIFSDTMIESMPGILYFYDENRRFLRWNRNFEVVSKYTPDEIKTMQPLDFFAAEDKQRLAQQISQVFEKGESFVEAAFVTKDGCSIPYFFTGRRVVFDDTVCLVGVGIDISERKQMELEIQRSELRYRSTLDNILEACQIIGFDWHYLYLNKAAAIHNRRDNAELLGKRMTDVWPNIEASGVFQLLKRCMEERIPLHEETEFVFMDGSTGWFDVRAQPVPEGVFILSIDISDRKKADKALRELNETLELKVTERTEELRKTLVRAEAADHLKSAFLATMSHELRTPLNSIIGFTGILLKEMAGPLNPEQARQLGMVRNSARHLLELINDVLDLSKIEAGQLEVRSEGFDLPASIERAVALVGPLAQKRGIILTTVVSPELGEMWSDRRRVEQILINLLNNAIKFTDVGSVTLRADLLPEYQFSPNALPRPALRLDIADTGIGMKPEDLTMLFQPFRQIDTGLSRQHEGTGLGLAICQRLTSLMGGEIFADSEWGNGSVFSVILPLRR